MGLDFTALIHYPGPRASREGIRSLEKESTREMKAVHRHWDASFHFPLRGRSTHWGSLSRSGQTDGPPDEPSRDDYLCTRERFYLTFCVDCVIVYHPLRWQIFLLEPPWQRKMLAACLSIGRVLGGDELLITRDESDLVDLVREGLGYEAALKRVADTERAVDSLEDLYLEPDDSTWDSKGYLRRRLDGLEPLGEAPGEI